MGYILSNGIMGVNFNDSSSIVVSADQQFFDYLEQEVQESRKLIIKETFSFGDEPPEKLFKKITLLKYFQSYLDFTPSSAKADKKTDLEFLIKYMKTKHSMVFRLSSRLIQFNFFDHSRLLLYNDGLSVLLISADGEWKGASLYDLLKKPESEITQRLKYAHSVLSSLLTKRDNPSK